MSSHVDPTSLKSAAKELLLADYHNLSESFWNNELSGETRVNWFIGIVTAGAGGLIGLTAAEHRPHGTSLRLVFLAVLIALFAFGFVTLIRIMKRNETTDGYKKDSETIRKMFRKDFDGGNVLVAYHPYRRSGNEDVARKFGGLAHTVLMINSLLLAGMITALFFPLPVPEVFNGGPQTIKVLGACFAGTAAFVLALLLQFLWVQRRDEDAKARLDSNPTDATVGSVCNGDDQHLETS